MIQSKKTFSRGALLSAVGAGALIWAGAASAQTTTTTPAAEPSEVEAVVVTGFRSSLEKALQVKR
jgi:iron complex outermembrane receptor protein